MSDVDDTLLGDDLALSDWVAWLEARPGVLDVAYSSGRFIDSILESVATTALPEPRAVVGGVGTEIRVWPDGAPLKAWNDRMRARWDRSRLSSALEPELDLTPQPEAQQGEFKLSYFLMDAGEERLEQLLARARAVGVEADLIYSSKRDLDFVPRGVNKGSAARFLAEHLGYEDDRVFVAGNSGNDIELFRQGYRGVIVGNAHDDLKRESGPRVHLAQAGFAAGVREGLERWLREDGA